MLLLATFFPDSDAVSTAAGDFNPIGEFLRCSVEIADLLGIAFVLSRIPGKGHSKLISAGLGWAAAEVILSRGVLLWIGARGAEFSWIYIQKSLESNILLVSSGWIVAMVHMDNYNIVRHLPQIRFST